MKVVVTGCNGQLGWELRQTSNEQHEIVYLSSAELDISNSVNTLSALSKHLPDIVINAAAYTAVDKAESDESKAYAVNEKGVLNLAQSCKTISAKLIHISTDFVFDGTKNTPYLPTDKTNPVSVYGASKLAGEQHVHACLANDAAIIRTAWVYSQHGNNFVKTMLRLMSEKEQLGVVCDQIGTPTWARGLADMVWALAHEMYNSPVVGQNSQAAIYHWTDAGVASWYDFAVAIQEIAYDEGLLLKKIPIRPILSEAYPTPAKRPSFSVLDKVSSELATGQYTKHWRDQLKRMISAM